MSTSGPEAKVVAAILKEIRDLGGWAIKTHGSMFGAGGEPDVSACIRGRMVQIEVKQPGEHPTPRQYEALRRWEAAGALAGWADSVEMFWDLLVHVNDPGWRNAQLDRPVGIAVTARR